MVEIAKVEELRQREMVTLKSASPTMARDQGIVPESALQSVVSEG